MASPLGEGGEGGLQEEEVGMDPLIIAAPEVVVVGGVTITHRRRSNGINPVPPLTNNRIRLLVMGWLVVMACQLCRVT